MKTYFCIDVGGTAIKYGILDEELKIYEKGEIATPYEGVENYLQTLHKLYKKHGKGTEGIAMSVPGLVDSKRGLCITGGSLHDVKNLPLADELEGRCHIPVTVMNDAKAAALAESKWGALKGCDDGAVILLGTAIGGALIHNGQVIDGKHFSAGEFSYIIVDRDGDMIDNIWAGKNGIGRLTGMAARIKGMKKDEVSGRDVFRWANNGEPQILELLNEFTKNIAQMILNLQFIFDPERIAIGGGISQQDILFEYIRKNVDYFISLYRVALPRPQVVPCKFLNDANLIGALGYFLKFKGNRE